MTSTRLTAMRSSWPRKRRESKRRIAGLFPGQGAFYKGTLRELHESYPQIERTFSQVDAVADEMYGIVVSEWLFDRKPLDVDEMLTSAPDVLQLAIYGISVAVFEMLESHGLTPHVLVGHSFGEIAAMVSGGSFSVREGAEIVCHRMEALRKHVEAPGYMAALGADSSTMQKIVEIVGNQRVVIAGVNHDRQTVVSGSEEAMDLIKEIVAPLKIPFIKLRSPYAFHSPLMKSAAAEFADRIRHLTPRPIATPVFSPILGRYYNDKDNLTACLAEHLVRPVQFAKAVQNLHRAGTEVFVEIGASQALCKMVQKAAPDAELTAIVPLDPRAGESGSFRDAVQRLGGGSSTPQHNGSGLAHRKNGHGHAGGQSRNGHARFLLPHVDDTTFSAFWSSHGKQVLSYTRGVFKAFEKSESPSRSDEPKAVPTGESVGDRDTAEKKSHSMSRDELFKELTITYARALEYPEEVFTEDVDLEAELGIDSVKQTELLGRVAEHYNLPRQPDDFRLSDYHTMGKVTDFVLAGLSQATPDEGGVSMHQEHAAQPAPEPSLQGNGASKESPAAPAKPKSDITRAATFKELTRMYAEALEYPEEVFTEDVELEAELGIDSVKQTELLGRVAEHYNLPPQPDDFRLSDYHTMGKVTDFVHAGFSIEADLSSSASSTAQAAAHAMDTAAVGIVT